MLHLGNSAGKRAVIAGVFLWMMLVVTLPWTWWHQHNCRVATNVQVTEQADTATPVIHTAAASGEDHCPICSHTWPSFIASDALPELATRNAGPAPDPAPVQSHARGRISCMDGRGPPMQG